MSSTYHTNEAHRSDGTGAGLSTEGQDACNAAFNNAAAQPEPREPDTRTPRAPLAK